MKINIWVRGRHAANFNDEKTDVRFYNVTYTKNIAFYRK